jgi:hypothetical protein
MAELDKAICKNCGLELFKMADGVWKHLDLSDNGYWIRCTAIRSNAGRKEIVYGMNAEPAPAPIVLAPATVVEIPPAPVVSKIAPDPKIGKGGGPTRATILPTDAAGRKKYPLATGLLDYFPDALAEVSHLSYIGNEQHNPGQPLHWARGKSMDHADTMMRHFVQRGTKDVDGVRHSVKAAWRALANLQEELEAEMKDNDLPF